MTDSLLTPLTIVSALGCGLNAGFFFAFSICVMKALKKLPPAHGIAAMQSINVVVINPWFLFAFFGTALACVILVVFSLSASKPGAVYLLVGSLLYLIGTILVTMVFNVPRNNALAAVDPATEDGDQLWADYVNSWTAWNHVRTIAALVAAATLTIELWR